MTVKLSATVRTGGGTAMAGAGVTFTTIEADGSTGTVPATTDASGTAAATSRVEAKDPIGTW
jgi:hypothetical protein